MPMKISAENHKKIIAVIGILVFTLLCTVIFFRIGRPMITFASDPEKFRDTISDLGFSGKLIFLSMLILQTFVALIPGEPLEICAGYAFGAFTGALLCILGEGIGSIIVFLFVRKFGIKAVEIFFDKDKLKSIKILNNPKSLNTLTFILFLIPGTPKDLLCYAAGLTNISFKVWLIISFAARIPSIVTSTIGGNALGIQNYASAVIVFIVTVIISVTGIIIYNKVGKS